MSGADEQHIDGEIPEDIYCPGCGYNLRGAAGAQCSECGHALANIRASECGIPWEHRRRLGRLRTYWQTVWMVTNRNRRFCEEYAHDVRFSDARRFQLLTALHIYLPILAATVLLYLMVPPNRNVPDPLRQVMATGRPPQGPSLLIQAYAEVWPVVVLHLGLLAFLVAATGVPSYFFHPKAVPVERQNSAVAMSLYTCGPLAALLVAVVLLACFVFALALVFRHVKFEETCIVILTPTPAILLGVVAAWYFSAIKVLRRTMPQLKRRAVSLALALPFLWLGLAALLVVALPLAVLYILLVITSFGP
jgi:hypothetical protein